MTCLFVTGTDTDVGKTRVSVALMQLLAASGVQVAAMKPIASGCEVTAQGLRNDDALQLIEQATVALPYEVVNPYAFEPAIAPHIAAEQMDARIKVDMIKHCFDEISSQTDSVVVEGAGGWLVPIGDGLTLADVAVTLGLPGVVVVDIRVGCINHALLTVEAIKRSGLSIYGWVANHTAECAESDAIINTLNTMISSPCLGVVPVLSKTESVTSLSLLD
jgi:dethiobiotin synthetase